MKWRPEIVYGDDDTVLDFQWPQRWWETEAGVGMGDEDETGAGLPHSYVVRYDEAVTVKVRFSDDERIAVMTFVEWAMTHNETAFTFQFDRNDDATVFTVYLESPKMGDMVRPTRSTNAPWTWELALTLRSVNGTRLHVVGTVFA